MASTSTSIPTGDNKIILAFAWQGPNRCWDSGCPHGWCDSLLEAREVLLVSLVFKDATKQFRVPPENINPTVPGKFAFTVQDGSKTTRTASLRVAIEKVRHLDLVVDISGSQKTESRKVALKIPETLEPGQTYTLLITSKEFEFSACLVKSEETKKESGMKEGTLPAGQQPTPTSSTSASDLDRLSVDELQTRLADCFQRDKDLEVARLRTKNVMEQRTIMLQEKENLRVLLELGAVLEGRGITCQLPDTERYKAAAREAQRLVRENMRQNCSLQ